MTAALPTIEKLLQDTGRIVQYHDQIQRLKGENFNVFSILGLENAENQTHSAMIGELLNPKGSHLLGDVFLRLFLAHIRDIGELDCTTAKVELEKHIGWRDDANKTGGRVDIYISDEKGNSICIENKIYASDQYAQVERYVNHNNSSQNKVYYLTLHGSPPSEMSKGNLIEDKNYFCLSYQQDIVRWLEEALKVATDQPILRETIKQYMILIKKLTGQLTDRKMEKEIQDIIRNQYAAAKLVSEYIGPVERDAVHAFLLDVIDKIEEQLPKAGGWTVTLDEQFWGPYGGISIAHTDWNGMAVRLQGESRIVDSHSYYGIVADSTIWDRVKVLERLNPLEIFKNGLSENRWWPYSQYIEIFSSTANKMRLFGPTDEKEAWATEIAHTLSGLASTCKEPLSGIPKLSDTISEAQ